MLGPLKVFGAVVCTVLLLVLLVVAYFVFMVTVGVWPPVSTRQDMDHTIIGGLDHKIKACTALLGVHRKLLYSTK